MIWMPGRMPTTQDNEYRCQLRGSDKKKNQRHCREIGAQGKNLKMILLPLWSEFVWPVLRQINILITILFQHDLSHSCGPRRSCQLVNREAIQRWGTRASLNPYHCCWLPWIQVGPSGLCSHLPRFAAGQGDELCYWCHSSKLSLDWIELDHAGICWDGRGEAVLEVEEGEGHLEVENGKCTWKYAVTWTTAVWQL